MQWLLGRLRGRLGVAVVLLLVILAAVGIGRALGSDGNGSASKSGLPALGAGNPTTPVANPSEEDDDGVDRGPSPDSSAVSLSPGAAGPLEVSQDFMTAWLKSQLGAEQWHTGVSRLATPDLADKLSGVDPAGVPAERVTGDPQLIPRGTGAAGVTVPVDSGTVELGLIVVDGRWLVDAVDWSRG